MKKYQIVDNFGNGWNAGSKATNDCVQILEEIGFDKCLIERDTSKNIFSRIVRQLAYLKNFREIYKKIEENSVVVIQNPFKSFQLSREVTFKKLKKNKNVKFISIVHDVDLIRESNKNFNTDREFATMLEIADKLIVHNEKMKKWFIEKGVAEERLECLKIFDYLSDVSLDKKIEFSKRVLIAGNLAKDKSPYIYALGKVDSQFDLFGISYKPTAEFDNVNYHGAFPAEEIPMKLNTGFGLVWDGSSVDTCDGDTGRYLRYNNPHKLSLYLTASIPVIIWDQAAEADFILEHNIGIVVSSLHEISDKIENLTEEEYYTMVNNVKDIQKNLKEGYYLKKSINNCIL